MFAVLSKGIAQVDFVLIVEEIPRVGYEVVDAVTTPLVRYNGEAVRFEQA
jgi:hypothetical protein